MGARSRLKHGVYENKSRTTHRVVLLEGPDRIWATFNGTNYPAVMFRDFNQTDNVKIVITESQFRDRFRFVGKYKTVITTSEVFA